MLPEGATAGSVFPIVVMTEVDYPVIARERAEVPAGSFDCFRVEGGGQSIAPQRLSGLAGTRFGRAHRADGQT